MSEEWQFQIRVYLTDAASEAARHAPDDPALRPLRAVLDRHAATLVSQYDAFADYVAQAERDGPEGFPLYRWTRATLDDPAKRAKHARAFSVRVGGQEVYARAAADALEADLQALVGGTIVSLSRHDTNPASNLPVPPQYRG